MAVAFKFKVLLLGSPSVGKTSILNRFVNDIFEGDYMTTIGAQFLTKEVKIGKEIATLNIWDIGGQKRFADLRTTFYRGANGALLIFDLVRRETFEELNEWITEMNKVLPEDLPVVLIGNKADLIKTEGRKVAIKEGKMFAKLRNNAYVETSAKTGKNVERAFLELSRFMTPQKVAKKIIKIIAKEGRKGETAYFVKSRVRDYIKSQDCMTSTQILNGDALNDAITALLDKAIERTKANKRKTVKPIDI